MYPIKHYFCDLLEFRFIMLIDVLPKIPISCFLFCRSSFPMLCFVLCADSTLVIQDHNQAGLVVELFKCNAFPETIRSLCNQAISNYQSATYPRGIVPKSIEYVDHRGTSSAGDQGDDEASCFICFADDDTIVLKCVHCACFFCYQCYTHETIRERCPYCRRSYSNDDAQKQHDNLKKSLKVRQEEDQAGLIELVDDFHFRPDFFR